MAGTFPPSVVIDQKTDFFLSIVYKDSNGNPVNLTGYTARFALAQYNQAISLTLTQGNGITLGTAGQIDIHATSAQTSIPEGTYDAELDITSGGGITTALLKSPIVLKGAV